MTWEGRGSAKLEIADITVIGSLLSSVSFVSFVVEGLRLLL